MYKKLKVMFQRLRTTVGEPSLDLQIIAKVKIRYISAILGYFRALIERRHVTNDLFSSK